MLQTLGAILLQLHQVDEQRETEPLVPVVESPAAGAAVAVAAVGPQHALASTSPSLAPEYRLATQTQSFFVHLLLTIRPEGHRAAPVE